MPVIGLGTLRITDDSKLTDLIRAALGMLNLLF